MLRGRKRALLTPLLAAGLVATALACGSSDPSASGVSGATAVRAKFDVNEYGVSIEISVGFPEERTVYGARLAAGRDSVNAFLYPLDGTDPMGESERIRVGSGDRVLVEGKLFVPCSGAREVPVFQVDSRADGVAMTDLFIPEDVAGFARAVVEWCDRPFTMSVVGESATVDGDHELRLRFSNPGPESVTVTSEAVDDGTWVWQAARVFVPAGSTQMTVIGHGPPDCVAVPPWESGHVRADGDVVVPNPDGGVATTGRGAGIGC